MPGIYTVKLTVDGKALTAPLTVVMDPRVKTTTAGLRQKFEAQRQLASAISRSARAIRQATSLREQLEKLERDAKGPVAAAIAEFGRKLRVELLAGRSTPIPLVTVNGDAYALYGDLDSSDSAPTSAQMTALTKVTRDLSLAMDRWKAMSTKEVAALNQQLKASGLTEFVLQEAAVEDDDTGDDDVG